MGALRSALILVDYFNVSREVRRERSDYASHTSELDELIAILEEFSTALTPAPSELRIRLYGGWFDEENNESELRSMLGAIVRQHFPRRRKARTLVELADAPLSLPGIPFPATWRYSDGLDPFQIRQKTTSLCSIPDSECGLLALRSWRAGNCPNKACHRTTPEVCGRSRQKVVDTQIVADAVLSAAESTDVLLAVSNDDDILPAVFAAKKLGASAYLVRMDRRNASPYEYLCEQNEIPVIDLRR